jgi:hypothetical protein
MRDAFDPYHKWLGIPPEEQPPDRYRLLGIQPLEDDPDVIEAAADQRMMLLRTYQTGRHSELSQKLLNEVAAAKVCLLKPEKKAAYDQRLRQDLEAQARIQTPAKARFGEPAGQTAAPTEAIPRITVSTRSRLRPRKTTPRQVLVLVLAAILVAVGVLLYALWRSLPSPPPPPPSTALVFDWPENQREGATLEIDGRPRIPVPPKGAVRFPCPPGQHHFIARRPRYKPVQQTVTVKAGEHRHVQLHWQLLDGILVFRFPWPKPQPQKATLRIDGKPAVPLLAEARYPVEPDLPHTYEAIQPGFRTIRQTVTVAAGGEKTVKLDWEPLPPRTPEQPLLGLHWPEDQRVDATLLIDGRPMVVPERGRCEYPLEPGEHRVVVRKPGFEPFEQTVMLAAGESTIVEVVSSRPEPITGGADPSAHYVTLNVEKERFAYELQTDEPLSDGVLYVELWGPQSWAIPARFEPERQHVPLDGKVTVKLNGSVTIGWSQIPGAEISVKFIRLTDGLRLQTASVYNEPGGITYPLTPSRMKDLSSTLPKNLAEKRKDLLYLQQALPAWTKTLQSLQARLLQERSRPPRSRNPRTEAILAGQIREKENQINKGRKEYARLPQQIQKLDALVQVLPKLENLVNHLHDSKLYYRVFTNSSEDR